jgi:uncharacterized membrane protein
MHDRISTGLTLTAAGGSALMAGTYFAFSTFVMPALDRLPPSQAIAAMQSINTTIVGSPFIPVFLGTAVLGAGLAVAAVTGNAPNRALLLSAAGAYLLGSFGVTMLANVPLNDALAARPAAHDAWQTYSAPWTGWNHVRTIGSLLAALLFVLARP